MHPLSRFVRYALVGAPAFAVDVGTFGALLHLGLPLVPAAALGCGAGMLANYLLCASWVFAERRAGSRTREAARFFATGLVGTGLNVGLTWGFTVGVGFAPAVGRVAAAVAVLGATYALRAAYVFRTA